MASLRYDSFDATKARFIRFQGTSRWNTSYGHSVFEFGAYTVPVDDRLPIRINTGGGDFEDNQGNRWQADVFFDDSSGGTYQTSQAIAGTTNDTLYQSERWCPAGYNIPVANGTYVLRMHFAEINPRDGGRVFSATAEGKQLFSSYNISATVGDFTADVKSFDVTVADGELSLRTINQTSCSKIAAIEILEPGVAVDTTPPNVSITTPTESASVSGTIDLAATAEDDVSVSSVSFLLNGRQIAVDSVSPFATKLDTSLYPNGTHQVTAVATDSSSNTSTELVNITINNPVPDTQAPSAPTNLKATSTTFEKVALAWSASTDDQGVKDYEVYRNGSIYARTTSLSYTDTNVTPGATYSYTVRARDNALNTSQSSSELSVNIPQPPDTQAPTKPTVSASVASETSAKVSWSGSTDNVGVTSYSVLRDGVFLKSVTGTSYTDSTVSAGQSYTYSVVAFDAAGNYSQPGSASVTMPAAAKDTTPPSNPYNLYGWYNSGAIKLFWKPSVGETPAYYRIYRDGKRIGSTMHLEFGDGTVRRNSYYTYYITAVDAAGNESVGSNRLTVRAK